MAELSAADRALLQQAQEQARARMSGRTIDETGRDVVRLSNLLTIPDPVATMTRNGGRQDATTQQGQDGRAAAALPPSDTIGSRDFLSCGGITEVPEMFAWQLVNGEHGWFFRLRAQNGNIICTSEIYSSREAAEGTLKSLAGWFGECAVLWAEVSEP
jgi:uncharacterized protein YegP (UPF0339 family)